MEKRNKELALVKKLIKFARCYEDDKQISSLIISDNDMYIKVKIIENQDWSEEEISILKNVTEIVEIKTRAWIIPSTDYISKKFMKISSINYDTDNKELQERLEISDNEDHHIDYIVEQTRFPCSILNYI